MTMHMTESLSVSDHFGATLESDGELRAYTESPLRGTAAAGRMAGDNIQQEVIGRAPQGEDDTAHVCARLVRVLNAAGAAWGELGPGQEPADCLSLDSSGNQLAVQVVRADSAPARWRTLAQQGRAEDVGSAADRAKDLRTAIAKKAAEDVIPTALRADLVLALDASRLPAHAFPATASSFVALYGEWARGLGFASIWVVGPTDALVHRLDREV